MMEWGLFAREYLQNALMAGLCAGVACGITGVIIVTAHLSFLGVCLAHAALAGATLAVLLGVNPLWGALLSAAIQAAAVGPLADRGQLSMDSAVGILFSVNLGLAFLFIGMMPGPRTSALSLFWGSILTLTHGDVAVLACVAGLSAGLLILFFKEVQAVVCHRAVALAVGIPATAVFYGMILATGITIAASLTTIGGLLIYSLLILPAAAAFQLTYSLKRMFILAAVFGVLSCWAGLAGSYLWHLPTGATIVLTAALVFSAALLLSKKRGEYYG